MKKTRSILPLAALALLVLAVAPAVSGSTLTVTINPTSKSAELSSTSSTTIVLTYPADSNLAKYLSNLSNSVSYSSSFTGNSIPALVLQSGFELRDHSIQVQKMAISYSETAKGNDTALVIHKVTNITASVTGLFTIENGTVDINLGWRSFYVPGNMSLDLQGRMVDVNFVGSAVAYPLSNRPLLAAFLFGRFGGDHIWNWATLNFSALDVPLTTWTRNYDSSTNTTTFSKTITGASSFSASADYNGQKYTLTVSSDPSAKISTQGYAIASADSLAITSAPGSVYPSEFEVLAVAATVALVAAFGTMYFFKRSHSSQPATQAAACQAAVSDQPARELTTLPSLHFLSIEGTGCQALHHPQDVPRLQSFQHLNQILPQ